MISNDHAPFILSEENTFPDPALALKEPDGLLAIGGNLSTARLLEAYRCGIFPWCSEEPILWWSPDPRAVLFLADFHVSHSLRKTLHRHDYTIKADVNFNAVIEGCSAPRPYLRDPDEGTWITPSMMIAYQELHTLGYAHSVEVYSKERLIGGVYGMSLGRNFFAESMFSHQKDASKIALFYLVKLLSNLHFEFIDCQVESPHLMTLGATLVPRALFLQKIATNHQYETIKGKWSSLMDNSLVG